MPRTASSRKKAAAAAATADPDPEEYSDSEGAEDVSMMFSQQMPEMSQVLPQPKDREKQNLDSLDPHVREKLLTTLSRLLLFKALAGETIDKVRGRVCVLNDVLCCVERACGGGGKAIMQHLRM